MYSFKILLKKTLTAMSARPICSQRVECQGRSRLTLMFSILIIMLNRPHLKPFQHSIHKRVRSSISNSFIAKFKFYFYPKDCNKIPSLLDTLHRHVDDYSSDKVLNGSTYLKAPIAMTDSMVAQQTV